MFRKMLENLPIPYAHEIILILAYAILGGGIKYIDQAFDIGVFNNKIATILSVPLAILMGLLVVFDPISATIFLAVVLGVAVSKKIDNIAFQIAILTLIIVPILFHEIVRIEWFPFGFLVLAAIIDEYGNDWSDRYWMNRHLHKALNKKTDDSILKRLGETLFSHRPVMKITILLLALANYFNLIYFIAFLAFDWTYKIIETISLTQKTYRIKEPLSQTKLNQLTTGKHGLSNI